MSRQSWGAILLIGLGVLLLLHQLDLIYLTFRDLFTYGMMVLGAVMLINGFGRESKKGVLSGVFFLSYGLVLTLMKTRVFVRDDEFGFGALFLCLALANLVFFALKNDKWPNLAWTVIFGVLGGSFMMSWYGYFSTWYIYDNIERFWPVALIILGAAIIAKGMKNKAHSGEITTL